MKHLWKLILLALFQSATLSAQDYTQMVVDHARWIYIGYGEFNETRVGLEILGDTTINNSIYKKVFQLSINSGSSNSPIEIQHKALTAFLREDISSKKVYCLTYNELPRFSFYDPICQNEISNGEFLLYDFDLTINDTLTTCVSKHPDFDMDTVRIEEISDQIHFGYNLKTYSFPYENKLIEGIGFDNGLFQSSLQIIVPDKGFGLLSYCREENINDCLPSSNERIGWNEISIYPNPSIDLINLTSSIPFSSIVIYDQIGKMKRSLNIESSTFHSLDISELSKGTYFIKIGNGDNEYLLQKVIKE